ncbi:MAG: hypothetical protein M3Z21_06845 [Pseudomonadota bacterium]|nr:hypothetical protein [Pseudomonadota bacterium]
MRRTALAIVAPPAAVFHYGRATNTAFPIGVFYVFSLVAIGYGLGGGTLGGAMGSNWWVLGLGVVMWAIAAVWARLVIGGVDDDFHHRHESTLDHRVVPTEHEPNPLEEMLRARLQRRKVGRPRRPAS